MRFFLTEGVFDALALRHYGYNAIALGSCHPQNVQLSVLRSKYKRLTICFDNDFHGKCGAYYTSCLLNAPVAFPRYKDAAESFERSEDLILRTMPAKALRDAVFSEAAEYNRKIDDGWIPERPLPYNYLSMAASCITSTHCLCGCKNN
jgi:DNA primase